MRKDLRDQNPVILCRVVRLDTPISDIALPLGFLYSGLCIHPGREDKDTTQEIVTSGPQSRLKHKHLMAQFQSLESVNKNVMSPSVPKEFVSEDMMNLRSLFS
jgi:hypothetical protein